MAMEFVLEACVDSLSSARAAKEGGATRLELCANLIIGGTTPSLSLVRRVKEETGLPVHALLRPRFGDFLYTQEEFELLLEDGAALLDAGADALVSGLSHPGRGPGPAPPGEAGGSVPQPWEAVHPPPGL